MRSQVQPKPSKKELGNKWPWGLSKEQSPGYEMEDCSTWSTEKVLHKKGLWNPAWDTVQGQNLRMSAMAETANAHNYLCPLSPPGVTVRPRFPASLAVGQGLVTKFSSMKCTQKWLVLHPVLAWGTSHAVSCFPICNPLSFQTSAE